jgi:phage shock protein C
MTPHVDGTTPTPYPPEPPYRTLRRPLDDRMIAGVCSGIGRYANVDPNAVRVFFALVAVLTWGTALLAYPIAWFLIPEDDPRTPAWERPNAPVSPPRPPTP